MSVAIRIEDLSKAYKLGVMSTGTLSRDLERWWAKKTGKGDPFSRIGDVDDSAVDGDIVWSLRDINLDVNQGEALGIIGRNGAGKSTLLKVVSRVTTPTTGRVKIKSRIASLLEVGIGFHPELTGRENIYLNGAILAMRRKEIDRKLDEIIDFSGVERYMDTPVKRYSSGMYVRLAFAVAAHLESEILIVDEVLAVGDAEFQKKCLGKVKEVATGGRTVLFVSHNMGAIQQLCTSVLCLNKGTIAYHGNVERGMQVYFSSMREGRETQHERLRNPKNANKRAFISGFDVEPMSDGKLTVAISVEAAEPIDRAEIAVGINDVLGVRLITLHSRFTAQQFDLRAGHNRLVCVVDDLFLRPGPYTLDVSLGSKYDTLDYLEAPMDFELPEYSFYPTSVKPEGNQGYLMARHHWSAQ